MFVCISHLKKSCHFIASDQTGAKRDLIHCAAIQKKQPETVLSFGPRSQWPSASCRPPRTEACWSGGMTAAPREAGLGMNKSFDWIAVIKASIDVASFLLLLLFPPQHCRLIRRSRLAGLRRWPALTLISEVPIVSSVCLEPLCHSTCTCLRR